LLRAIADQYNERDGKNQGQEFHLFSFQDKRPNVKLSGSEPRARRRKKEKKASPSAGFYKGMPKKYLLSLHL